MTRKVKAAGAKLSRPGPKLNTVDITLKGSDCALVIRGNLELECHSPDRRDGIVEMESAEGYIAMIMFLLSHTPKGVEHRNILWADFVAMAYEDDPE